MRSTDAAVLSESDRIKAEYARRETAIPRELYAPWDPAVLLGVSERRRVASTMLHEQSVFPTSTTHCLEVGCGSQGWLAEFVSWGIPATNIHAIELDGKRAESAQRLLPGADIRVGDAVNLPWNDESFGLVVASTLFTSILNNEVRRLVADEITRVLAPGGALLWYDFKVNNPQNHNVRKVTEGELESLFPSLSGEVQSVRLAPPLARLIARRSWTLAVVLAAIPFLRTHLLGVLKK